MSDLSSQYYELAFHITANLEEADVQKTSQDLEKIITSDGGVISYAKNPEKIRLAYPIKHQTNAFFGYFNFALESPEESVTRIRDDIRLNSNVLRFLILKHEPEPKADKEDIIRKLASAERRKIKTIKQGEKSTKGEASKLDEKMIDEKLEEIIEKL